MKTESPTYNVILVRKVVPISSLPDGQFEGSQLGNQISVEIENNNYVLVVTPQTFQYTLCKVCIENGKITITKN